MVIGALEKNEASKGPVRAGRGTELKFATMLRKASEQGGIWKNLKEGAPNIPKSLQPFPLP